MGEFKTGQTVCKLKRRKITRGENNSVYSIFCFQVYDIAQDCGIKVHLDGARLMHAAVALGVQPSDITRCVDSVNMCFSKVK